MTTSKQKVLEPINLNMDLLEPTKLPLMHYRCISGKLDDRMMSPRMTATWRTMESASGAITERTSRASSCGLSRESKATIGVELFG